MRITVIGYSGCGKSTLAKFLSGKYHIPVLYLDTIHWLPEWEERTAEEEEKKIKRFLDNHENWVIDGNYSHSCYERRMEEADKIIIMNMNRFVCLYRVLRRYLNYKGKTRESMTEGCLEKFDFEFIQWILHKGRTKKHKKRYQDLIKKYGKKVIMIKNQKQLNCFMKSLNKCQ